MEIEHFNAIYRKTLWDVLQKGPQTFEFSGPKAAKDVRRAFYTFRETLYLHPEKDPELYPLLGKLTLSVQDNRLTISTREETP